MTTNPADAPSRNMPAWLNSLMAWMLRTPGLQRVVGRTTLLVTYQGRKSGKAYTLPLSYLDLDDRVLVSGHRTRLWWRNMEANPNVQLRIAGKEVAGVASVMPDPESALADYCALLEAQPMLARMAEVPLGDDGKAERERALEVLAYTVVVSIKLEK